MWVIFEGLDKAGKGTLEWEFLKATNFKHIVIDRGPVGYAVFDVLFDRKSTHNCIEFNKNINLMRAFPDEFFVIYCKAPVDIAMQRLKEHNETCPYDYENAQGIYDRFIDTLYRQQGIRVVTVNTEKSIETCVNFIIDSI